MNVKFFVTLTRLRSTRFRESRWFLIFSSLPVYASSSEPRYVDGSSSLYRHSWCTFVRISALTLGHETGTLLDMEVATASLGPCRLR